MTDAEIKDTVRAKQRDEDRAQGATPSPRQRRGVIVAMTRAGTSQGVQRWKVRLQNGDVLYTSTSSTAPAHREALSLSGALRKDSPRDVPRYSAIMAMTPRGTIYSFAPTHPF